MQIVEQMLRYLDAAGLCVFNPTGSDSTAYIDQLPDRGENIVSLYNRAGEHFDSKHGYPRQGVQAIFRGTERPMESYAKAQAIFEALCGFSGCFVDGGNEVISCLSPNGGAFCIGTNKNHAFEYTMNFIVEFKA